MYVLPRVKSEEELKGEFKTNAMVSVVGGSWMGFTTGVMTANFSADYLYGATHTVNVIPTAIGIPLAATFILGALVYTEENTESQKRGAAYLGAFIGAWFAVGAATTAVLAPYAHDPEACKSTEIVSSEDGQKYWTIYDHCKGTVVPNAPTIRIN